jgi:hypothetical protein
VLKTSSFVLMLMRCQLCAEDFQLSVDVDGMPSSPEDFQPSVDVDDVQPSCCDTVVVDVVSALCCY